MKPKTRFSLKNQVRNARAKLIRARLDNTTQAEINKVREFLIPLEKELLFKRYDRSGEIRLTKNDLSQYSNQVYAEMYWHIRGLVKKAPMRELKKIRKRLENRLESGDYENEVNDRGNIVNRSHVDLSCVDAESYLCKGEGWKSFPTPQDAPYYGVWVNPLKRAVVSYVEGDIIRVTCPTAISYNLEIQDLLDFHGEKVLVSRNYINGDFHEVFHDRPNYFIQVS